MPHLSKNVYQKALSGTAHGSNTATTTLEDSLIIFTRGSDQTPYDLLTGTDPPKWVHMYFRTHQQEWYLQHYL